MLKRENGWALSDSDQDIWRELIDDKRRRSYTRPISHASLIETRYVNNITGDIQDVVPLQFRGGLLADPMGLGKTLSIIALISSDRDATRKFAIAQDDSFESIMATRKTTLLVAPSTREIRSF